MFQVSKDGQNWTTLYTHVDDCSLNEPGYELYTPLSEKCGTILILSATSVYLKSMKRVFVCF